MAEILDLAPEGGILVVPVVTRAGGAAYVIPHGTTALTSEHVLDLPHLTVESIGDLLSGWLDGYGAMMERVALSPPPLGGLRA